MYVTSQAYKNAIRSASRPYDTVYGTITLDNGTVITVDASVMPTNAITISHQCIDGEELMFGGVYAGTLKLSLLTDLERYAFFNSIVCLNYKIQIGTENDEPVYEVIPLGIFTVDDAERPNKNQVTMTAYDNMLMLGKELGGFIFSGTPWEVLQVVSEQTGIELGFTEEDLDSFTNIQYQVEANESRGIQNYFDVVKMICQQLGCFAYADRNGRLALKRFSARPDISLTMSDWYSFVPADYKSKYVGLSVTSLAGVFTKTDETLGTGNIMVIEDAPAWDFGSQEALQDKTENLFSELRLIDEYTPCELDMPSDPSFDCGDRLACTPRGSLEPIETLITSIEWKFHQGMSISSEGLNPNEGSSAIVRESTRIVNQAVAKSKLQFVSFTNMREKIVGDNETVKLGDVVFTPTNETNALVAVTILVDIDVADTEETTTDEVEVPVKAYDALHEETVITDIHGNPVSLKGTAKNTVTYKRDGKVDVSVFYRLNGIRLPNDDNPYIAIDRIARGRHVITLVYPLNALVAYTRYEFEIWIISNGGTITVPIRTMQATILGQELQDSSGFGGRIVAEDDKLLDALAEIGAVSMTDNGVVTLNYVPYITVSDDVLVYNIDIVEQIPLAEGTGSTQPQIYMRSGFDLLTENDFYFAPESGEGARFITEGQRGDE